MIILDTNTLSETLKPAPSNILLRWLASQDTVSIYTTAISQAEMLYGVEALPPGKRRQHLAQVVEEIFAEDFAGRVLPFDQESAREFAKIVASRKAAGRPISQFDAMIAGIARSQSAAVATRNTGDFEHCGIRLINPWIA
ncbi:MAG TPA: type II toxin-antitoxin system VapC family toxin [Bryobacteraceae bacterium]|nr:type II toxin-antitoxin system VapC family toxin [Bryobacteraceae bacterium]